MYTEIRPNNDAPLGSKPKELDDTIALTEDNDTLVNAEIDVPFKSSPILRFGILLISGLIVGLILAYFLQTYYYAQQEYKPLPPEPTLEEAAQQPAEIVPEDLLKPEKMVGSGEQTIDQDLILDLGGDKPGSASTGASSNAKVRLEQRKFLHSADPTKGKIYAPTYTAPVRNEAKEFEEVDGPLRLKPIPQKPDRLHDGNTTIEWQSGFYANNPEKNIEIGKAYKGYLEDNYGKPMVDELSSFEKGRGNLLDSVKGSSHGPKR